LVAPELGVGLTAPLASVIRDDGLTASPSLP
jgi:hypothetical protein